MNKKIKILVTGGSGFIGTNVILYYIHKATILNIDIHEPKDSNQIGLWKQVDLLNRKETLNAIIEFNPDYIIHLAARTDIWGKNLEDYDVNITGVKNVLDAAVKCSNLKKILITSSMLVCKSGYMPKHQRDYCPTIWYGRSKVETENITWENKPLCDWALLRPTSMWGPWFDVPYRNFFDMVKSRKYFHIGNLSCTKTYGYIDNGVYQIDKILHADTTDENNKVFYLGDKPAIFIEEWANQIASELGHNIPKLPFGIVKCIALIGDILVKFGIPFPMYSFRLKNMCTDNIIDLENTYKLAPNPPVERITGIKRTLSWMKKH